MTRRRVGQRLTLTILCLFAALIFTALGVWQVERRTWKLDLIARVEERLKAPPVALPPAQAWPAMASSRSEYLKVVAHGHFRHDRETLVDALTELGPGYWVVTPFETEGGQILVNRGFVPPDRADPRTRAVGQQQGDVVLRGLVRLTEPHGRFLRPNAPARHKWFSRDVAAIARSGGLGPVAPFFIDADATPNPGGYPVGGLTVVHFRNAHLVYALTWFALAAMSLAGLILARRPVPEER